MREDPLGQVGQTEQVDLELVAGVVDRNVLDGTVETEAGIVDHDVDPVLGFDDLFDHALVVLGAGDVERDRDDASGQQFLLHPVNTACRGVDPVALLGEENRRRLTHAR